MNTYTVEISIDASGPTPEKACKKAWEILTTGALLPVCIATEHGLGGAGPVTVDLEEEASRTNIRATGRKKKKPCPACSGRGLLVSSNIDRGGRLEIQRCDLCERFASDFGAAIWYFAEGFDGEYFLDAVVVNPKEKSLPGLPT